MENIIEQQLVIPTTKEDAIAFADKMVSEVMEGNVNALQLHVKLTAMQKAIDQVKERIKEVVLKEATTYGAKSFDAYTSKIEIKELGAKYDFSVCNHPAWNEANDQIKSWTDIKKALENFLKTVQNSMQICNESTGGEYVTINPPIKTSTTGVVVTLK